MVPKIKTKSPKELSRPYDAYRSLPQWKVIEKAVNELVKNNDLEITTDPYCVIGYLVKCIRTKNIK